MLPQAFGPFESTAEPSKLAIQSSRLAYARDDDSLAYIKQLFDGALPTSVLRAPDFTGSVKGVFPEAFRRLVGGVAIVPNWNIHERASTGSNPNAYIDNLVEAVRASREKGLNPFGLCHEGSRDRRLLELVKNRVPDLEIVGGLDGVELKGLLGAMSLVVSGRYHALISGLSQGVPSILHGWSHKYRWLAEDYDVESLVIDPFAEPGTITSLIGQTLGQPDLVARIRKASTEVKAKSLTMWSAIAADFSGTSSMADAGPQETSVQVGEAG
jgi:colanic acid/amylovoran biosynthesis protein